MSANSIPMGESKNGWFKYLVLTLLFLGWCLGNMDRFVMNYAMVGVTKDFHLNATATGLILSSFFIGYALMQIPGGWFADRFGSRKVLLIVVFAWSLFTALTGIAWSLVSMVAIRVIFGLAEGSFFPSASKMISETFPPKQRGVPMSIMLSSSAFMTILVPFLASAMMPTVGWRYMFYVIGAAGVVLVILYQFLLKPPAKGAESNQTKSDAGKAVSFKELLKMPVIWNSLITYYCLYTIVWGLFSWLPTYLTDIRHVNMKSMGVLQFLPGLAFLISMLTSGFIIDKIKIEAVKVIAAFCAIGTAILLYLMYRTPVMSIFVIYQTIVYFVVGFMIIFIPSYLLKQMPSEVAGSASGLTNFGAQLAGIFTPFILGMIIDAFHGSFEAVFWYLTVFACIPAVLFPMLRASVPNSVTQSQQTM